MMNTQWNTRKSMTGPVLGIGAMLIGSTLIIGCAGNNPKPMTSVAHELQSEAALPSEQNPATTEQAKLEAMTTESAPVSAATEVATITYPDIDIEVSPQPEQLSFQFGFDKAELGKEDKAIIKQHAKYLLANPEVMVKVVGHTDHYGPKAYNEYLSKKRAEAVTAILLAEGVMESQIEIKAMADNQPLEMAQHARDNRRVELEFEQMNLVSN